MRDDATDDGCRARERARAEERMRALLAFRAAGGDIRRLMWVDRLFYRGRFSEWPPPLALRPDWLP